jgi:Xaa-Pro aminopeptidase
MSFEKLEIPKNEYEARRKKCAKEAAKRGLKGMLIWSRGGGTLEKYADVMYLANHYTPFPVIRNYEPYYSAKGYAAIVLPLDGDPALLVDIPYYREDLVTINDVRASANLLELTVKTLRDKKLSEGKVGLVGEEILPVKYYQKIAKDLPKVTFQGADDILENQRMIKSENEINIIRASCKKGVKAWDETKETIKPGKTEAAIIANIAQQLIIEGVAIYNLPASSGPHSDSYTYETLPAYNHTRKLKEGDIFHVDIIGAYKGYLFDFARTVVVGRPPTEEQTFVIDTTEGSVNAVIDKIKPGATAEEVSRAGFDFLIKTGYLKYSDITRGGKASGYPAFGHGIGLTWEQPILIEGDKTSLKVGMYLAVEKTLGKKGIGASFEENLIVTESGVEVLTKE